MGPARPHVHRFRQRRCRDCAGSLPSGDRACADRTGAHGVARLQLDDQRAGAAAGQEARRRDLRRARVLLQLRRRGQRGRAQAGAALRARSFRSGEGTRDLDAQRFPRPDAIHGHRGRPSQVRQRFRPAAYGLHAHPLQRHRRIGSGVCRRRWGRYLRGDPRAYAGRGRHDSGNAGIPRYRASAVRRARRAARFRRDSKRHGPHGCAVLVHAEGRGARHPDVARRVSEAAFRSARC